ncbi:MAG: EAL domain-containing protein [Acidobacteria bacterium]|nr:EAL domain-containing protein [Acidobacteriota bacterium]
MHPARRLLRALNLPLLCGAAAVAVWGTGALQPVDHAFTDLRFRLLSRPASGRIVVVAIDPTSLEAMDIWPWPRGVHATLLENLLGAGASSVALDLDFSSRSTPGEDRELAAALAAAGRQVILPAFVQWDTPPDGRRLVASVPLPEFSEHARLASINIVPEGDGRTRRYRRQFVIEGRTLPSLAVALSGEGTESGGPFSIDFGIRAEEIPRLSYLDVLTGQFDVDQVRDRVILVGATSVELGDQVSVPIHTILPGAIVQALAFESLAQGRALARSGPVPVTLSILVVVLAFGGAVSGHSWRLSLAALLGAGVAILAASIATQGLLPVVPSVAPPLLAVGLCFASGLARRLDRQGLRLLWQRQLIRQRDLLIDQVMSSSFDAILTLDRERHVMSASAAACRLFSRTSHELTGMPLDDLIHADFGGRRLDRVTGIRANGSTFPAEMVLNDVRLENGEIHVALLRDVSERKAQEDALRHRATHDALTDLPNRVLLQERMKAALATCSRLAVFILDLNRFREVNDTLGHHTGDGLLRDVARRLREAVEEDATLARIGGDEFALLLPGADEPAAGEAADRIQASLTQPFVLKNLSLDVGVSIGIALYPEHGTLATELLQHADVAMYHAKNQCCDTTIYDPKEDRHSVRHLTLVGDLKNAIHNNGLSLAYQPKLSCATGETVGMEALVRWHHPVHGPLPPEDFIRVAENTGLIQPLSLWVLRTALGQARRWRDRGWHLPVAVNLSVHNLKDGHLPQVLSELLTEWDLPPELLTLEVTESVLMENPQRTLEVIEAVARLGVRISIDDFGTGYSSLSYLKRLPAREVKIDRAFVLNMDSDMDDLVIVRSIIDLAHNLGLEVVAEGVEREVVWHQLVEMGCDFGQGYFFSKPREAARFTSLPRAHVRSLTDSLPGGSPA